MSECSHLDYIIYGIPNTSLCTKCKNFKNNFRLPLLPAETYRKLHQEKQNPVLKFDVMDHLAPKFSHFSATAFSKLKPITIDELENNAVAVGKYIMLRAVEDYVGKMGWHTVGEDTKGNACFLSLYNYSSWDNIWQGDVLIIKEPHYHFTGTVKLHYIRVDSPSDILNLTPSNPLHFLCKDVKWKLENVRNERFDLIVKPTVPNSFDEWTERGCTLTDLSFHSPALDCFMQSLRQCQPKSAQWREAQLEVANRLINLGYYDKALLVLREITKVFPQDLVALCSLGELNYHIRFYHSSSSYLEDCLKLDPYCQPALELCSNLGTRLRERDCGVYDFDSLKSLELDELYVDDFDEYSNCSDYRDLVKEVGITGKGRGLVLKRKVAANTLLLASKVLSFYVCNEEDAFNHFKGASGLVESVADIVFKNPKIGGRTVYDLYSSLNPTRDLHFFCNPEKRLEPICRVDIIRDVCLKNAIAIERKADNGSKKVIGYGLFPLASLMNHDCVPTVSMEFKHNMLFVYSIKPMKTGEELLISYVPQSMPPPNPTERRKLLELRGVPSCKCHLCTED